jgi:hypothetical protein
MRWVVTAACALGVSIASLHVGCSGDPTAGPDGDAASDRVGLVNPDAPVSPLDAGPRLTPHDGVIVSNVHLGVVYVGDVDAGGMPGNDAPLEWLVAAPYWGLLKEYGVGTGAVVGSARVATGVLLQPGDIDGATGLVELLTLDTRIAALLHGDADAGTGPGLSIPGADAYVFYLPDGVNVALGHRGTYTYQTCIDANGYHAFDGFEPYAVMPPCDVGRSLYAAAHELSEVVTDPEPYHGWLSDTDLAANGGEVADLCPDEVMQEGVVVTRLWSNAQDRCVP